MKSTGGLPRVFLERSSYRQRRLMDALRLLPIMAALLWLLPLFWPSGEAAGERAVAMSDALTFVFVVWLLMIAAAIGLGRYLRPGFDVPLEEDGEDPH